MGCTPSMHVNPSGVVHCQEDDSGTTGQLTGVQGHFRPTCDGEEGTSKEAPQNETKELSPYEQELLQGSLLFQKKAEKNEKEEAVLKFGPMCLKIPTIRVLLVFGKDDAQSDALKWAAERLSCECTVAYSPETATDAFQNFHPHLVFIDSRQSKFFDPAALCKSIHSIQGSQYSCFVAVVKKSGL